MDHDFADAVASARRRTAAEDKARTRLHRAAEGWHAARRHPGAYDACPEHTCRYTHPAVGPMTLVEDLAARAATLRAGTYGDHPGPCTNEFPGVGGRVIVEGSCDLHVAASRAWIAETADVVERAADMLAVLSVAAAARDVTVLERYEGMAFMLGSDRDPTPGELVQAACEALPAGWHLIVTEQHWRPPEGGATWSHLHVQAWSYLPGGALGICDERGPMTDGLALVLPKVLRQVDEALAEGVPAGATRWTKGGS